MIAPGTLLVAGTGDRPPVTLPLLYACHTSDSDDLPDMRVVPTGTVALVIAARPDSVAWLFVLIGGRLGWIWAGEPWDEVAT